MKPHRRGITRITWFKLTVCACLAAMAASSSRRIRPRSSAP
ncbi:MAG: hypothetical protein ACLSCR_08440 [Akkermansia sp.]